jgi:hypothetical protein
MKTCTFAIFIAFCFLLPAMALPNDKTIFNVRSFGAIGDGTNLDSPTINRAIPGQMKPAEKLFPVRAGQVFNGLQRQSQGHPHKEHHQRDENNHQPVTALHHPAGLVVGNRAARRQARLHPVSRTQ